MGSEVEEALVKLYGYKTWLRKYLRILIKGIRIDILKFFIPSNRACLLRFPELLIPLVSKAGFPYRAASVVSQR